MGILMWILFGLVVGVVAKLLTSERSPQGFVFTILLGIAGAIVGGFFGQLLGFYQSGEPAGFLMAVIGSITLLGLYTVLIRRRFELLYEPSNLMSNGARWRNEGLMPPKKNRRGPHSIKSKKRKKAAA